MRYEFKLPDIGEGIHEAELLEWRVKEGDTVKDGQEIVTLNTDKVTVELPAPCDGKILSLHGKPGEVLVIGTVIAVFETDSKLVGVTSANQKALEALHNKGHSIAPPKTEVTSSGPKSIVPTPQSLIVPPKASAYGEIVNTVIVAGPSTRKVARELGVDLKRVLGSGPNGRILRADVEAAANASRAFADPVVRGFEPASGAKRIKLSGARATSAKNLFDSVHKSATTTSTFEVAGDGIKRLQAQLAPEAEKRGAKITPIHFIAKCAAAALSKHERFNATIDEATGDLLLHDRVDLGVAVAAADRLIVPVIRGVDQRLLFDVVRDIADVSQRARDGKLQVADFKGGTFTVSSTGGLERATMISTRPIINPPQTAILWCSRITDRPRVIDGQLSAGPMMVCSLSFDHRYIDGAEATRFINDLAEYLENPERALV